MPKTRTNKRSADDSSARSETRHSRKPSSRVPVHENKTGLLTPAICFCDDITKKDEDDEEAETYATIKAKIADPNGTDDRVNREDKKSPQIKDLTYAGAEVMKVIQALDLDLEYRQQACSFYFKSFGQSSDA